MDYKVGVKLIGVKSIRRQVPGMSVFMNGYDADLEYTVVSIEKVNKTFIKLSNGDRIIDRYSRLSDYGNSNIFGNYMLHTTKLESEIKEKKKNIIENFNKIEVENIIIKVKKDRPYQSRDEFYIKALKEIIKELENKDGD